ncbi:MAG: outer membrane lipoprotein carrier protein LolA [Paracoccaceae bacterium]
MLKKIHHAAIGAALLVLSCSAANAQNAVVDEVNTYLNSLITARAAFTQESADGSIATGTFYLQKPGKMRFEYDEPSPALLVADGSVLAIFDKKSNRGPQRYPQSSTPLSLLSRSNIDIQRPKFVQKLEADHTEIHLTLFDPEAPNNGSIKMIFKRNPVRLVKWIVVERSGLESVIRLEPMTTNISLNSALFSIPLTIRALGQGG